MMPARLVMPTKRKYRNTPVTVDGIKFASKHEAKRWSQLKLLEQAGQITGLERQVKFELRADSGPDEALNASTGPLIGCYVADFTYIENGKLVVEDAKGGKRGGTRTALYNWKKKHFEAQYGLKIREV